MTLRIALASLLLFALSGRVLSAEGDPQDVLQTVEGNPHTENTASLSEDVLDMEVGLGALQKIRGEWRFKDSERVSGSLQRNTWQVAAGFSSAEIFARLVSDIATWENSALLFSCEGRACGHGSQWANRVFGQRVLYGRDDLQRYRVFAIEGEQSYRLLLYSSARSSSRQYLHIDLIRLVEQASP